jgi:hypothetical protein
MALGEEALAGRIRKTRIQGVHNLLSADGTRMPRRSQIHLNKSECMRRR